MTTQAEIAALQAFRDAYRATFNPGAAGFTAACPPFNSAKATIAALRASHPASEVAALVAALDDAMTLGNTALISSSNLLNTARDQALALWAAIDALVPSDPPIIPPVVTGDVLGFDERTISADYWSSTANDDGSNGLSIKWDVKGGPTPPANLKLLPDNKSTARVYSGDVTAEVNTLIGGHNTGFVLRATGAVWFGGRLNGFPPQLIVDGVSMPCIASQVLDGSSAYPLKPNSDNTLNGGQSNVVLRFDLSSLAGKTARSAVLSIHGWASGAAAVNLAVLKPPQFQLTTPPINPVTSLAALRATPGVYFADAWDTNAAVQRAKYSTANAFPGDYNGDGLGAVFRFGPDQQSPLATEWYVNGTDGVDTLYTSWSYRLLDNGSGMSQGQKFGLTPVFRMGYLQNGKWVPVEGNGGTANTGLDHPDGLPDFASSPVPRQGYLGGGSARTMLTPGVLAPHPQAGYRSMFIYAYPATMAATTSGAGFGEDWHIPNTVVSKTGETVYVEVGMVMNTVTGVPSTNGVGNPDGVFKVRFNGGPWIVVTSTAIWRHNTKIKFIAAYWCFYHGGTDNPLANSKFWLGPYAAAAQPIGPIVIAPPVVIPDPGSGTITAAQVFLDGKPKRTWLQVPGTALTGAPLAPLIAAGLTNAAGQDIGYGSPNYGQYAYSGGTLVRRGGQVYLATPGGGGANAWAGNDWPGLELTADVPRWTRLNNPTAAALIAPLSPSPVFENLNGTPAAMHSYWSPQHWNGDDYEVFLQNMWSHDSGQSHDVYRCRSSIWSKVCTIGGGREWDAPWIVTHPITGMIYVGMHMSVEWFNPINNTTGTLWIDPNSWGSSARGVACIRGDELIRFGRWGASDTWVATMIWNLRTGVFSSGSVVGYQGPALDMLNALQLGSSLEVDPKAGTLVSFSDDANLCRYDTTNGVDYVQSVIPLAGTPPPARQSFIKHGNGPRGRHRWVPELEAHVIAHTADADLYAVAL